MDFPFKRAASAATGLLLAMSASGAAAQSSGANGATSHFTETNMTACLAAFDQGKTSEGYARANGIVCQRTSDDGNKACSFALTPDDLDGVNPRNEITIYEKPAETILGSQRAAISVDADGKPYDLSLEADGSVTTTGRDLRVHVVTDLPSDVSKLVGAVKSVAATAFAPTT